MPDRLDRLERRVDQLSLLVCQLLKESPGRAWSVSPGSFPEGKLPPGSRVMKALQQHCISHETKILLPEPVSFWEAWDLIGSQPHGINESILKWEMDWFLNGKPEGKFRGFVTDLHGVFKENEIPSAVVPRFECGPYHNVKQDVVYEFCIVSQIRDGSPCSHLLSIKLGVSQRPDG